MSGTLLLSRTVWRSYISESVMWMGSLGLTSFCWDPPRQGGYAQGVGNCRCGLCTFSTFRGLASLISDVIQRSPSYLPDPAKSWPFGTTEQGRSFSPGQAL